MLLFVSKWFQVYALELAGARRNKVGTSIELAISDFFNHPYIYRVLYSTVNFYFYT